MNCAVVYYSMSGNTAFAAERIVALLGAELIHLEPVKTYPDTGFKKFYFGGKSAVMGETPLLRPYSFSPAACDCVVICSPVWASRVAPPIRSFLRTNGERLRGKRFALCLCCKGGGADKAAARLKKELEIPSFAAELVLIDPKDQPKPEHSGQIRAFCACLGAADPDSITEE